MSEYSKAQLAGEGVGGLGILILAFAIITVIIPGGLYIAIWLFPFSILCIIAGAGIYVFGDKSSQKGRPPGPQYQQSQYQQPQPQHNSPQHQQPPPPPSQQQSSKGKPCPDCKKPMEWVEKWDEWYCENCDEYKGSGDR